MYTKLLQKKIEIIKCSGFWHDYESAVPRYECKIEDSVQGLKDFVGCNEESPKSYFTTSVLFVKRGWRVNINL